MAGVLSPGAKREVPEVDHSPLSSAEIRNEWSYTSTLPLYSRGVYRDSIGDISLMSR